MTFSGGFNPWVDTEEKMLYFVKRDTTGLWQQSLHSNKETLVTDQFDPRYWGNATYTGDEFYGFGIEWQNKVVRYVPGAERLEEVVPLKGKYPQGGRNITYAGISNDLYFSQIDDSFIDLMVVTINSQAN